MKNITIALLCLSATFAVPALSQDAAQNGVFAQALIDGTASAPIPANEQLYGWIQEIKAHTHDAGPIMIQAKRLLRFKQQPRCGRILFSVTQPSSGVVLPIGGQLNVCEDGSPPLRSCKDRPDRLVLPQERCRDGSEPQDTPEVDKAIKDALANGDLSQKQVEQQLKDAATREGAKK